MGNKLGEMGNREGFENGVIYPETLALDTSRTSSQRRRANRFGRG